MANQQSRSSRRSIEKRIPAEEIEASREEYLELTQPASNDESSDVQSSSSTEFSEETDAQLLASYRTPSVCNHNNVLDKSGIRSLVTALRTHQASLEMNYCRYDYDESRRKIRTQPPSPSFPYYDYWESDDDELDSSDMGDNLSLSNGVKGNLTRYRLIWAPPNASPSFNESETKLAFVDEILTLRKEMSYTQKEIFIGWINIQNITTDQCISFNLKEFNSEVFSVYPNSALGILLPKERHSILIRTLDTIPYKMVDLVNEKFSIFVSPCHIVEDLKQIGSPKIVKRKRRRRAKPVMTATAGDTGCNNTGRGQPTPEEKLERTIHLSTKIESTHLKEFWDSFHLPQAQIYSIKEIQPLRNEWLEESSSIVETSSFPLPSKKALFVQKYFYIALFQNVYASLKRALRMIPRIIVLKEPAPDYQNCPQPWASTPSNIQKSASPRNRCHFTFCQAIDNTFVKQQLTKFATCCVVLFLFLYSKDSPFLSLLTTN